MVLRIAGGVAAVLAVLAVAPAAKAHDDPASDIARLDAAIAAHPEDASLYLQRAELQRELAHWPEGLADLQTASRLDPAMAAVDLAAAELLLRAGQADAALAAVDRFLSRRPGHAGAELLRGRALRLLGREREAAAAYDRGIALARSGGIAVQPDDYLERAKAVAADGSATDIESALRGLDDGIAALGGAITLRMAAIDLELARGDHDAALTRIAEIERTALRKEAWSWRRAEILSRAGRDAEAADAARATLAAIDRLPPRLRELAPTRALEERARTKLREEQALADTIDGQGRELARSAKEKQR